MSVNYFDEDHIQWLDDSIIILSMSGPCTPTRLESQKIGSSEKTLSDRWHLFLDNLSWLCDYKSGGKTVTSIAAEDVVNKLKLWVATNSDDSLTVARHLRKLMQEIRNLAQDIEKKIEESRNRIFRMSIDFSHRRVESYANRLGTMIQHAQDLQRDSNEGKYQELSTSLIRLMDSRDDHKTLCLSAFSFRKSLASELLSDQIARSSACPVWPAIRHYIGRLGSWWKASLILTTMAQDFPWLFKSVEVKSVPPLLASITTPSRGDENFATVFDRFLSACPDGQRQQIQRCFQHRPSQELAEEFKERSRRRQSHPRVHAEILILEHFYRTEISFANNDQYIGCSKPSCYCCDVYMRVHPLSVVRRPCHNNTWVGWCLPPQDARIIVEKIVHQMRQDIVSRVCWNPNLKVLESTTGITTNPS